MLVAAASYRGRRIGADDATLLSHLGGAVPHEKRIVHGQSKRSFQPFYRRTYSDALDGLSQVRFVIVDRISCVTRRCPNSVVGKVWIFGFTHDALGNVEAV